MVLREARAQLLVPSAEGFVELSRPHRDQQRVVPVDPGALARLQLARARLLGARAVQDLGAAATHASACLAAFPELHVDDRRAAELDRRVRGEDLEDLRAVVVAIQHAHAARLQMDVGELVARDERLGEDRLDPHPGRAVESHHAAGVELRLAAPAGGGDDARPRRQREVQRGDLRPLGCDDQRVLSVALEVAIADVAEVGVRPGSVDVGVVRTRERRDDDQETRKREKPTGTHERLLTERVIESIPLHAFAGVKSG